MEESETSGLKSITETVEDLITGIPSPIRKNFFKAFSRLCTAAVDIPVAHLEGKAEEIRAAYKARIQILEKQGEQISEEIRVPNAYIDKASEKFASRIIKEQLNLDEIGLHAANNLKFEKNEVEEKHTSKEISDDWLNEFENYAKLKSSDDMKMIFGKILSGEIKNPGTFSIRTVRLISQLDNQAARLFQRLCSQTVSMYNSDSHLIDARVVSIEGSAESNSLTQYGLSYDNLNILHEYGLIISNYNSFMNYWPCIYYENSTVVASLHLDGNKYGLLVTNRDKFDKNTTLRFYGVALSKAGKELLKIIPLEEASRYKKDFQDFLAKKHVKLVPLGKQLS
ncbi:MAG: DUF2806 domain-containing protein [Cyclobacteriaceae bacterium]|nr:DUF2806 domain-containing protein [Cyclobacteriaceae bacterium]